MQVGEFFGSQGVGGFFRRAGLFFIACEKSQRFDMLAKVVKLETQGFGVWRFAVIQVQILEIAH